MVLDTLFTVFMGLNLAQDYIERQLEGKTLEYGDCNHAISCSMNETLHTILKVYQK